MNSYLMSQLAEARHQDLVCDARHHHRVQLARSSARYFRRSSIRSALRLHQS